MSILKKTNYFDIGRNATADEFLRAFQKVAGFRTWNSAYTKTNALINGAIEAFHAGSPENIQTLLQRADVIKVGKDMGYFWSIVDYTLYQLSEKRLTTKADIALALARVPVQEKSALLNRALVRAIDWERSPSFIKLLYESGASFDAALSIMHAEKCHTSSIGMMMFYQETLAGKPAVIEVQPDILLQIQQQLKELTARVDDLANGLKSPASAPAKKTSPVVKGPSTRLN